MNVVTLSGRLTKDPELKETTSSDKKYCRFDLAVNDPYSKKEDGKSNADFISCICWNGTAENLCKYQKKGSLIELYGRLHTYSYDGQDGTKKYAYDVIASQIEFLGTKPKDDRPEPDYIPKTAQEEPVQQSYSMNMNEVTLNPDDLPF